MSGAELEADRQPMLQLRTATDPSWVATVVPHLDELLVEQAHLEKKAASAALRFLFRYPEHLCLQQPLSELAREELEHFEQTLALLARRGVRFGRLQPSTYPSRLATVERGREPWRLLDGLLICAVIEARSCERMLLLSRGLVDAAPDVARFYRELVASEARHNHLYVELAGELFGRDVARARLAEIAEHEAAVVRSAPTVPRLHH